MMFIEKLGKFFKGYGMYVVLLYDEGKIWFVKCLLIDGIYCFFNGGVWIQFFEMDENYVEFCGYLVGI